MVTRLTLGVRRLDAAFFSRVHTKLPTSHSASLRKLFGIE